MKLIDYFRHFILPRRVIELPFSLGRDDNTAVIMGKSCPRCKRYIATYNAGYKFCPDCGQRLRW